MHAQCTLSAFNLNFRETITFGLSLVVNYGFALIFNPFRYNKLVHLIILPGEKKGLYSKKKNRIGSGVSFFDPGPCSFISLKNGRY